MTHLRIIQNSGAIEEVSSSVIQKLYELASSGDLDNTSVLQGRVNVSVVKDLHMDYFMPQNGPKPYQDFYITATNVAISFADPEVERVLIANNIGSSSGITQAQVTAVGSLPQSLFENNTTVTSFDELYKFANVHTVPYKLFSGATNLTSIDLSNIITIENNAFYHTGLTTINASNASSIGQAVFMNCYNLTSATLPSSMTSIPNNLFRNCSNLTTITGITNSPTSFGYGAFLDCNNLVKTFDLSSTTSVGDDTFKRCRNCTFSNFSTFLQNITSIGNSAFEECQISGVLTLPNCTRFGSNPFNKCSRVTEIHAPKLTSCSGSFSTITVFDAPKLGGVSPSFDNNTNLTTLVLDFDNITEIPNWGWNNCTSLTGTFDFAKLQKVGAQAFNNGNYNIVIRRTEAVCEFINWGNQFGTFSGTIYVPDSLLSAYRSHAEWSKVPDPTNQIKGISELPSS